MAVVLDRAQRDVLYRFVVLDLPDMGDISRELDRGNLGAAQRLRKRFDENIMLLDLLDWGESGERDSYKLSLPSEHAEAIFERLYGRIMCEVEAGVAALLDHSVAAALEAARVCTEALRTVRSEAETSRRAECLYEGQRRPDCA
jgi:hypothetical protein